MQKLGVFWKIQDICYQMGTEIFKFEEEMTEKMKSIVANPPSKNGQNSLLLFYLLTTNKTSFAFIVSHENAKGHQRSSFCDILPIFGGGVGILGLHFLSHFFFYFENLSAHLVANILNFPKHPLQTNPQPKLLPHTYQMKKIVFRYL